MTAKNRNLLILLFTSFVVLSAGLAAFIHHKTQQYALQEALKQGKDILYAHRAVQAYVTNVLRPDLFDLQESGALSQEYFSPTIFSSTFIARNTIAFLNDERRKGGLPEIYFKLASDNPRNPINKADAAESRLLRKMNGPGQGDYSEVMDRPDGKWLFMAVPVQKTNKNCLKCHGEPKNAPRQLVKIYGDTAGFFEREGRYRALISIRVPLAPVLKESNYLFAVLTTVTVTILSFIFLLIYVFIRNLDAKQQSVDQTTQRLKLALKAGHFGIWDWDFKRDILLWDDRSFELLGVDPKSGGSLELWKSVVHPDDLNMAETAIRDAIDGKREFNVTYRVIHPDGGVRYIKAEGAVVRDTDGDPYRMIGVNSDTTERKQAEESLRQSEARFRTLFETMHEGFAFHEVIRDEKGVPVDYRFLDINPAFERLTGLKRKEAIGRGVRELIPGIEESWIAAYCQVAETGEPAELENHVSELDRYYRARAYSPERGKFAVVFEDITAQKKAMLDLEQRQEELRVLIESSHAGIILVDPQGYILAANRRMSEMFCCPPEELIGLWYPELVHPDQKDMGSEMMIRILAGDIDNVSTERHYVRDGSDFWGYISVRRHEDSNRELISLVCHISDITDLKKAEAERLKFELQMLHSQKLESLGVLAGGIAHDFNNILSAIVGNTEIAILQLDPESQAVESLRRVQKSAARATDLSRQMLAYSGRGKFVIEAVDMNRLVEEMGHILQVSVSKKVSLCYSLADSLPAVDADATQIRQVVMNLVINASEAIGEENGVISISTGCFHVSREYIQEELHDENVVEGPYVYLEVSDNGCGMDRETLGKIFEPFFTTKFTGRGLGMAAVLGIVRGHKGAIIVQSEPGKGSSFKMLLPIGAGSNGNANLAEVKSAEACWPGQGKVLLVDDEESLRTVGAEMLMALGFTVVTASDGAEALDIYSKENNFDFVILDLTMPRLDGEQTFRQLRQINPNVKVIISSGYNEQEVTQKFFGKGLAGFIQKPYRLSTLSEAIHDLRLP